MSLETATAVRFLSPHLPLPPHRNNSSSISVVDYYGLRATALKLEESCAGGVLHVTSRSLSLPPRRRIPNGRCLMRRRRRKRSSSSKLKTIINIEASNENWEGVDHPPPKPKQLINGKKLSSYHPFEEIGHSSSNHSNKSAQDAPPDVRLTPPQTARTIVEVNTKATLMLTGLISDEIHENIIWPDLPYVTDEHGNIYFQVKNDEDILQSLTLENNFVQAIIGFDAVEMISEMELLGPSEIDFGIEEIEVEDSDVEEDDEEDDTDEDEEYDEDFVAVLEDEEEGNDSDAALGVWAKSETMRSSHPMQFAVKMSQVATDDPIDWMEQPPAGLAVQGLIRPALIEEHSDIQRHLSGSHPHDADTNQDKDNVEGNLEDLAMINDQEDKLVSSDDNLSWAEELDKTEIPRNGTSLYKLEMIKIQLVSALGAQTTVEVDDFMNARPDVIGISAAKIISRLKAGGEKITEAFKSLCWRVKAIQVEEAALITIDSLGFDLRVCSGTQIQTLRFAFKSRATSEYSAERQLNDLLFPRIPHQQPKKKQTYQK